MKDMGNSVSKVLGRTDIIAIGFGTMIGWSWVMMAPSWINEAGDYVTEDMKNYIEPLIQAELTPIMITGQPRHIIIDDL